MARIAIADSQPSVRIALRRFCAQRGHEIVALSGSESALRESLTLHHPDLWIIGERLFVRVRPEVTSLSRWLVIAEEGSEAPAMVGPHPRRIPRPIDFTSVAIAVDAQLGDQANALIPPASGELEGLVFTSESMQRVVSRLDRLAELDLPVLITGETGTGKELAARRLHDAGPRRDRPFVAIHCGAIPHELLESELFGHMRGSFTDAERTRVGRFEAAADGTILLDEIAELPLTLQAKLLRALQEKEFHPVGAETSRPLLARFVCATHADLGSRGKSGEFRADLLHRIAGAIVEIPPLRDRRDDLPRLISVLMARVARELSLEVEGMTADALQLLERHSWPGNVRELENVIRRSLALGTSGLLDAETIARSLKELPAPDPARGLQRALREWVGGEECDGVGIETLRTRLGAFLDAALGDRADLARKRSADGDARPN